jgi:hypothetical protein
MTKVVGFGDSFIYGSELCEYEDNSGAAWPAIIAQRLGMEYDRRAKPGCGNDFIAQQIYKDFSENDPKDIVAVINWTWISRWDFYIVEKEDWVTLGPSCVPQRLTDHVNEEQATHIVDFYNRRVNSSLLWNKFRNLQTIAAVQNYLETNHITNIQTYMDYELFNQSYHAPGYITELQDLIRPNLHLFDDLNFLDWSHKNNYPVTIMGMHPLKQAHEAAADHWQKIFETFILI